MASGSESLRSPSKTCKQCQIFKETIERKEKLISLLKEYVQVKNKKPLAKAQLLPHQLNTLRSKSFDESVKFHKELSELVASTKVNLQIHTNETKKIKELSLLASDKDAKLSLAQFQLEQLAIDVKEKKDKIKTLESQVKQCTCTTKGTPKKNKKSKERPLDEASSAASIASECPPSVASSVTEFPHAGPSSGPSFVLTPASSTSSSTRVPENLTSPGITWDSVSSVGSPLRENLDSDPQPPASSEVGSESQSKFCGIFESPDKTTDADDRCDLNSSCVSRNIFEVDGTSKSAVVENVDSGDPSNCDSESNELVRIEQETVKSSSIAQDSGASAAPKETTKSPEMPSIFDIPIEDKPPAVCDKKTDAQELQKPDSINELPGIGDMDVCLSDEESDTEDWIIPGSNDPKLPNRTENSAITSQSKEIENPGNEILLISPSVDDGLPKKVIPVETFLKSICTPPREQLTSPLIFSSTLSLAAPPEHDQSSPSKSLVSPTKPVNSSPSKDVSKPSQRPGTPSVPNLLNESDPNGSHVFPSPDLRALTSPLNFSSSLSLTAPPEQDENSPSKSLVSPIKPVNSSPSKDVSEPSQRPGTPSVPNLLNESDPNGSHVFPSPELRALTSPLNFSSSLSLTAPPEQDENSPSKSLVSPIKPVNSPPSKDVSEPSQRPGTPSVPNLLNESDPNGSHVFPSPDLRALLNSKSMEPLVSPIKSIRSSPAKTPPKRLSPKASPRSTEKNNSVSPRSRRSSESPKKLRSPKKRKTTKFEWADTERNMSVKESPYKALGLELSDDSDIAEDGFQTGESEKYTSPKSAQDPPRHANSPKQSSPFRAQLEAIRKERAVFSSISAGAFKEPDETISESVAVHEDRANVHNENGCNLVLKVPTSSEPISAFGGECDAPDKVQKSLHQINHEPEAVTKEMAGSNSKLPARDSPKPCLKSPPNCLKSSELTPSQIESTELSSNKDHETQKQDGKKSPRKPPVLEILDDEPELNDSPDECELNKSQPSPDFLGFGSSESSLSSECGGVAQWRKQRKTATLTQREGASAFPVLNTNVESGILTFSALRLPATLFSSQATPFNTKDCPSFSDLKTTEERPGWEPIGRLCYSLQLLSIAASSSTPDSSNSFNNGTCSRHDSFSNYRNPGKRSESGNRNITYAHTVEIKQEDSPQTTTRCGMLFRPLVSSCSSSRRHQVAGIIDLRCPNDCQDVHCCGRNPSQRTENQSLPASSTFLWNRNSRLFKTEIPHRNPTVAGIVDLRCPSDCQNVHCCGRKPSQRYEIPYSPAGSSAFSWNQNSRLFKTESPSPPDCCSASNHLSKTSQNSFAWGDMQINRALPVHSHFQHLAVPESSRPSRFCNANNDFHSHVWGASPLLSSPVNASLNSGRTTPPNGFRDYKQNLRQSVPNKLKLASPKLKNKTSPRAKFSKETSNSGRNVTNPSGQIQVKVSNAAAVEPNAQTPIHEVSTAKSNLSLAEKKPVKYHHTMESAMAALKKKYGASLSGRFVSPKKQAPCVVRKSGDTVVVEKWISSMRDGTSSQVDKISPEKPTAGSMSAISKSPKRSPTSRKIEGAAIPPVETSPKALMDPVKQSGQREQPPGHSSDTLQLPLNVAAEPRVAPVVDSPLVCGTKSPLNGQPMDTQSECIGIASGTGPTSKTDSNVHISTKRLNSAEVPKYISTSTPTTPSISVQWECAVAKPVSNDGTTSVEAPRHLAKLPNVAPKQVGQSSDTKPSNKDKVGEVRSLSSQDIHPASEAGTSESAALNKSNITSSTTLSGATPVLTKKEKSTSESVSNNELVHSQGLSQTYGTTLGEPSADSITTEFFVDYRAYSNKTSLSTDQNPTPDNKLKNGAIRSISAIRPEEPLNSSPVDVSIKSLAVSSSPSEDWIPAVSPKKKRIAHSSKVVESPAEAAKDPLVVVKSTLKPSVKSPLKEEAQPIKTQETGRSTKNKRKKDKKKKSKEAEPSTAPVAFKVPAGVGVHRCASCKFTSDLCSCHVERIVKEMVNLVDPLSPLSPSGEIEGLKAENNQTSPSKSGENGTKEEILQSEGSGVPKYEFASSFTQEKDEGVAATDILENMETECILSPSLIDEQYKHKSQEVPLGDISLGSTADGVEASSVVTLDRIEDAAPVEKNENLSCEFSLPKYSKNDSETEDMVPMLTATNSESGAEQSADVGDPCVKGVVDFGLGPVLKEKEVVDTSDTSIEDVEPIPKRTRKSLRNNAKVLRSRTVLSDPTRVLNPKAKPVPQKKTPVKSAEISKGKRRGSKVLDPEEEKVKCDVPLLATCKKTPKARRGKKSQCSKKTKTNHQDDALSPPSRETNTQNTLQITTTENDQMPGVELTESLNGTDERNTALENTIHEHEDLSSGVKRERQEVGADAESADHGESVSNPEPRKPRGSKLIAAHQMKCTITPRKVIDPTKQRRSTRRISNRAGAYNELQSSDSEPEETSSKRPVESAHPKLETVNGCTFFAASMDLSKPEMISANCNLTKGITEPAEESIKSLQSAELPSKGLDETKPAGKPDLAGWMTLRNSLVNEANLLKKNKSPSMTPVRLPGKRKLFDGLNGLATGAESPLSPNSVPNVPTTLKSPEEDFKRQLRERFVSRCVMDAASNGLKNDPTYPSSLNGGITACSSRLEGHRKAENLTAGGRGGNLEKSNSPDSSATPIECQPLAVTSYSNYTICTTSNSETVGMARPYSHMNQRSHVLSHVGNFFGKAHFAKPDELKSTDEAIKADENPKGSRSSSDVRTDSEVDSDQEMVIDYNSGSETPISPSPAASQSWNFAPSAFGFYSRSKDSETMSIAGTPSDNPTPQSVSFYSSIQSQNSSDAANTPSTSRSSPVPQFSGFYSTEPTAAESNAEPPRKLVSFCADEKAICVPISEEDMIPCCINIVGFAQHYRLPIDHQLRTVKAFPEPTHDLKFKLSTALQKYVKHSDGDNSLLYLKSFLSCRKILPSQLSKALCEILAESRPKTYPTKEEAKGISSYLSQTQKKAVLLLVHLGEGDHTYFDQVLTVMEQFLSTNPTEQNESLKKGPGVGYANIASVYALLCRSQGFSLRAQGFIFDLLYGRHISYFQIIHKILCIFPPAMPYAGPNNGPLTYTIAYLLMMQGIYRQVKDSELQIYGVNALRSKLQHQFGYSFPMDLTRDHVMDELMNNIMTKGSDKAIVLLCKSQGFRWAHGVALRYIFPVLNKVISGEEQDDFKVSRYIIILGEMSRGFAISICTPFVKKSLELLQEILKRKPSVMVVESVISALVHFQRLDLQLVTLILCNWTPHEGKVSVGCVKAVKRILAVKCLDYWKDLAHVT